MARVIPVMNVSPTSLVTASTLSFYIYVYIHIHRNETMSRPSHGVKSVVRPIT